jgi:DNA-binding response OmpR family regulator
VGYTPQILIVEDEPAVRYLLGHALAEDGYSVTALGTARQALRAVQDSYFELIILDMSLPDADGMDLVRQIHFDVPYTKVLAISGMMVGCVPGAARTAGADSVMIKPTTGRNVCEEVRRLLKPEERGAASAAHYPVTELLLRTKVS